MLWLLGIKRSLCNGPVIVLSHAELVTEIQLGREYVWASRKRNDGIMEKGCGLDRHWKRDGCQQCIDKRGGGGMGSVVGCRGVKRIGASMSRDVMSSW